MGTNVLVSLYISIVFTRSYDLIQSKNNNINNKKPHAWSTQVALPHSPIPKAKANKCSTTSLHVLTLLQWFLIFTRRQNTTQLTHLQRVPQIGGFTSVGRSLDVQAL